jgi:hypothetical protein
MSPQRTRVYTTSDGRAVIEQSETAVVTLSADEILAVIGGLRACYDYCATWKQPAQGPDSPIVTGIER